MYERKHTDITKKKISEKAKLRVGYKSPMFNKKHRIK